MINYIPAQYDSAVARKSGLAGASDSCPVNQITFASTLVSNVYVIGDKSKTKKMPKSECFHPSAIEKSMLQHSSRY